MRRAAALSMVLAFGALALAGCTSKSSPPSWKDTPTATADATGPGSTIAVCGQLRIAITADLDPLGKALGTLVGLRTAGTSSGVDQAEAAATTAIKKLASDLSSIAGTATAPAIRTAGQNASQAVTALASDDFLSGITSVDAIQSATQKLQQAAAPLTNACAGSG